VRSSWLILARNFDLAALASSAGFFPAIFLGESASSTPDTRFGLRALQVGHGGAQPKVVVDQLVLVLLDAGECGADRDVAAILGAALADMQQLPWSSCASKVRAPGACVPVVQRVRTSGMLPTSITVS